MPFTERDLRAMLEENSSGLPPTGDLAAAAEHRGRRVRRRRHAAGAVATAALVAVGFAVVPSLRPSDGPAAPLAAVAASQSPATPAARPDVDLSLLKKIDAPLAFRISIGGLRIAEPGEREDPDVRTGVLEDGGTGYVLTTRLRMTSIVGTVEGFSVSTELSEKKAGDGGAHPVLMKVRLGAQLDGSAEFQRRGLREGETIDLFIGSVDGGEDLVGLLDRAIPAGTRMLAFETFPLRPSDADPSRIRTVRSLILEDADGTPAGGPYGAEDQRGEDGYAPTDLLIWKKAKTYDELLEIVQDIEFSCPMVTAVGPSEIDQKAIDKGRRAIALKCLRHPPVPAPTPAEVSPAVPEPTPTPQ